jgi:peptidoglycan-associated lipoprotein
VNYRKHQWVLAVVLSALLALAVGCGGKKTKETPPPPPTPVTATLSADPATIQSGQSSTLTWSTQGATEVNLQGSKVDANGSQSVSPTQTTTYQLAANGPGGNQTATATVTVIPQPTPTPTPAPTPNPITDDQILAQTITDIYFDYDKADLRPEAQQALAKAAPVIKSHSNWVIRIEGNCDERGSIEYNLALGERRAAAAQQGLAQNGVSASQIRTVSNGKEKPVCTEANEECWQRNRNDHFSLVH